MKKIITLLICMLVQPALADSVPADQARSAILIAQKSLHDRAGPLIRIKAERAQRFLDGQATALDLAVLDAEVAARGGNASRSSVASYYATRYRTYLTSLAALDGSRAKAIQDLMDNNDASIVISAVNGAISAALDAFPAEN